MRVVDNQPFDAVANGETVIEYPEVDGVTWRDEGAVTCRRWTWRQGRRTGLSDDTRRAFFILDAHGPLTDSELTAAAGSLAQVFSALSSEPRVLRRLVGTP